VEKERASWLRRELVGPNVCADQADLTRELFAAAQW
jgi:hypothetical protein